MDEERINNKLHIGCYAFNRLRGEQVEIVDIINGRVWTWYVCSSDEYHTYLASEDDLVYCG